MEKLITDIRNHLWIIIQFVLSIILDILGTLLHLVLSEDTRQGKDTWIEWEMNAKCQQWFPIVYLYIICGIRWRYKNTIEKNWISLLIQCPEKTELQNLNQKKVDDAHMQKKFIQINLTKFETCIYSYPPLAFAHQN